MSRLSELWHRFVAWLTTEPSEYDDPYDNYWGSRIEDEWR